MIIFSYMCYFLLPALYQMWVDINFDVLFLSPRSLTWPCIDFKSISIKRHGHSLTHSPPSPSMRNIWHPISKMLENYGSDWSSLGSRVIFQLPDPTWLAAVRAWCFLIQLGPRPFQTSFMHQLPALALCTPPESRCRCFFNKAYSSPSWTGTLASWNLPIITLCFSNPISPFLSFLSSPYTRVLVTAAIFTTSHFLAIVLVKPAATNFT